MCYVLQNVRKVVVMKVALYPYLMLAVKAITLYHKLIDSFWGLIFPVSDHIFLHPGWSLTRELTM